jgi:hypothetical protein
MPSTSAKEFSAQEVIFRAQKLLSASLEKYAIDVRIDICG